MHVVMLRHSVDVYKKCSNLATVEVLRSPGTNSAQKEANFLPPCHKSPESLTQLAPISTKVHPRPEARASIRSDSSEPQCGQVGRCTVACWRQKVCGHVARSGRAIYI